MLDAVAAGLTADGAGSAAPPPSSPKDAAVPGALRQGTAAGRARVGAIVMAAFGESGAILGFVYYLLSADLAKLAVFAALTLAAYAFTVSKVNAAFDRLCGSR
jgi:hypothetical protein